MGLILHMYMVNFCQQYGLVLFFFSLSLLVYHKGESEDLLEKVLSGKQWTMVTARRLGPYVSETTLLCPSGSWAYILCC